MAEGRGQKAAEFISTPMRQFGQGVLFVLPMRWFLASCVLLPAFCFLSLVSCASATAVGADGPPLPAVGEHRRRAVVLVILDGLRADQVTDERMPYLARRRQDGVWAARAETVVPSRTTPALRAIWSGQPPERQPSDLSAVTTIFDAMHAAGLRLGFFAAKGEIRGYTPVHIFDICILPGPWALRRWSAEEVLPRAAAYLLTRQPDFTVVHLADIDVAGHTIGWLSPEQQVAQRRVDELLSQFVDQVVTQVPDRSWVFVVTADHGGHENDHPGDVEEDRLVPWIAWGSGVPQGIVVQRTVSIIDTASTLLRLLDVPVPDTIGGAAVDEVTGMRVTR